MPLEIELDYDRGIPVYRQIHEAVVQALASGHLAAAERLPTIAELARRLKINPNTVVRAYKDLEHDGYVVARRGSGTFTSPKPPGGGTSAETRDTIMRGIYERARGEAARHHISPKELVRYFRKALNDR